MAEKIVRGVRTTDEAPVLADTELSSFVQNITLLESLLFRTDQELSAVPVNIQRIKVYESEILSIQDELIAQQARAVATRGSLADDVQRLQRLLHGPMMGIVKKGQRVMAETRAKIDALSAGESNSGAPPLPPVDSDTAQGDDGEMEARIVKLEADLTSIKIDIGVIKANGSTKSDIADLRGATKADVADLKTTIEGVKTTVAEAKTAMIMWAVGAILVAQLLPAVKDFLLPSQKMPVGAVARMAPAASSPDIPTKP